MPEGIYATQVQVDEAARPLELAQGQQLRRLGALHQ